MHPKVLSRLIASLLLTWTLGFVMVNGQSTTQPSLAQITSALASGSGSTSLGSALAEAGSTLESIISDTIAQLARWTTLILFPERYYSYGRSPAVYPSPQGQGSGDWSQAYSQAKALVAQMTVQEKANITLGSSETHDCSGFTGSVPRLGFPGMCLNDAESGVRTASKVNGYPAQLHIGASWNRSLAYDRALHLGQEFKTKGVNVLLGPVAGPLGRIATGGRNWEGFSNDPYLAGSLIAPTISGMQKSVIACVKHFIANEQETNRSPFLQGFLGGLINLNNSVSSNVDDRTMHELYLWPFYDAVKAGAGNVRGTLADIYSDTLVTNVASRCKNTMVIIHSAGIRLVDRWIDHPNITAVIYANLPGQYSGTSLTEIIYGRSSPSGRLPFTVAKNESDYGSLLRPALPDRINPQYSQSDFTEGLFIDYKRFVQQNVTPRFAFGYGLTYSNFSYSGLQMSANGSAVTSSSPPGTVAGIAAEGGTTSLYDIIATVSIAVKNTGNVATAEVAQLYLGIPGSGVPKVLRGFEKQLIQPGASVNMTFSLRRRDMSIWDVVRQQWVLPSGAYNIMVGKSVLDIQLQGTLTL
ncbi:putative beta-glucosidase [Aureobasidium pullulans]|uniref:beta-glucosidase n=1 Tax=Aureobasidium pullulans TaxID=5580 RepID=A0A4S9TNJ5_AURPU|nr:putative beta-glucosidase [Aureobasidium pullulans]